MLNIAINPTNRINSNLLSPWVTFTTEGDHVLEGRAVLPEGAVPPTADGTTWTLVGRVWHWRKTWEGGPELDPAAAPVIPDAIVRVDSHRYMAPAALSHGDMVGMASLEVVTDLPTLARIASTDATPDALAATTADFARVFGDELQLGPWQRTPSGEAVAEVIGPAGLLAVPGNVEVIRCADADELDGNLALLEGPRLFIAHGVWDPWARDERGGAELMQAVLAFFDVDVRDADRPGSSVLEALQPSAAAELAALLAAEAAVKPHVEAYRAACARGDVAGAKAAAAEVDRRPLPAMTGLCFPIGPRRIGAPLTFALPAVTR